MKKELIINQPGLFLRLTGIAPIRTPVRIDITKLNMSLLLSELNMNSVIDYQIISKPEDKKKKIIVDDKPVNELLESLKDIKSNKETNKSDIDMRKDLNEIKSILKDILNKPSTIIEKSIYSSLDGSYNKKESKRKKKISDDFIPEVNISNLELKSSNIDVIKSDIDISENVDLLSKISKKKEK